MLAFFILYFFILALFYTGLFYTGLFYTGLFHTGLYYTGLFYTGLFLLNLFKRALFTGALNTGLFKRGLFILPFLFGPFLYGLFYTGLLYRYTDILIPDFFLTELFYQWQQELPSSILQPSGSRVRVQAQHTTRLSSLLCTFILVCENPNNINLVLQKVKHKKLMYCIYKKNIPYEKNGYRYCRV